jgi:ABC-type nickel/cobalt efflux system permease component RcnA
MDMDTRTRHSSLLSRVVSAIFGVIALILIFHIIFVWVGANANVKVQTFLNYGLAALVYMFIGAVLHRLFRNLG